MSDKLLVNIIITTYDPGDYSRYKLLYRVVEALRDNLVYPNLFWYISDDTRSEEHHTSMKEDVDYLLDNRPHHYFHTAGKGVGFGKNNALREAFKISPIVFLLEDDWWLSEPLDLLPHVQLLLDHTDLGAVRFGFLGGSMEATYTDFGNLLTYWVLKHNSGFYTYSGQISLRHARMYDALGYHAENCAPGAEEENFCWRYNKATNPPKMCWPSWYPSVLNTGPFKNIGLGTSTNGVIPENA